MWHPSLHPFPSQPPSAVIDFHRSVSVSNDVNENLFILIDKHTWRDDGVLAVNLSFKGHVDALRMLPNDAGDNIPALTTTMHWTDYLRLAEKPLFPRHTFAVYLLADATGDESNAQIEEVLSGLNGGFNGRKRLPPRRGDRPPVYVAVRQSAQGADSIDDVRARHAQVAQEEGFSPRYLIAVGEEDWAMRNVVLADVDGTDGEEAELTLGVETVGELVQWFWMGLTSMEEVLKESTDGVIGPKGLFVQNVDG